MNEKQGSGARGQGSANDALQASCCAFLAGPWPLTPDPYPLVSHGSGII